MKNITTNNKQQTTLKAAMAFAFAMLSSLISYAQPPNYAMRYDNLNGNPHVYSDNVVLNTFYPTSQYNYYGHVIFQTVYNNVSNLSDLVIHIVDANGALVATKRYELYTTNSNPDHMIPIAAAYNSNTHEYVVTGTGRNLNNNSQHDMWYLLLDQNLNFVNLGGLELTSGFAAVGATTNSTMVTDVCPIETSAGKRFAFVGMILKYGISAQPTDVTGGGAPGAIIDRRMFISILGTGGGFGMTTKEYELTIGGTSIDSNYFPSRIIEVPTQLYGGLFVTGIGALDINWTGAYDDPKGFFYFRTDFGLTPYDFVSLDDPNDASNFFSGGSLRYDNNTDDIYVSGTVQGNSTTGNSFFFDKIQDLSSTTAINCFSMDATKWNGVIGIKTLPTNMGNYAKSGIISQKHSFGNVVTGKIYDNSNAKTLPCLLECSYTDNDMMSWTTNQNNDVYFYPRLYNSTLPVQFYDGYDYNEIWYPAHSNAEYPFVANNTIQFGLAGLDHQVGTETVLNFTDNTYANDCSEDQTTVSLDFFTVASIGTVDVTDQTPATATVFNPLYNNFTPNSPSWTDCFNIPFKNAASTIGNQELSNQYSINNEGNNITIECSPLDKKYKIYSTAGSIIKEGNIENKILIVDQRNLAKGLYIIEILGQNESHISSIKFIQK